MKTLDLIHTHLFPTVVAHCVNTDLALRLLPYAHSVIKTHNNENNGVNYKSTYHVRLPSSILQNEFETEGSNANKGTSFFFLKSSSKDQSSFMPKEIKDLDSIIEFSPTR